MTIHLLFWLLPVVFFFWLFWRLFKKQTPSKHTLNILISLLLLIYFLITVGLGIFWVANQELPVFDLHFRFGYILILLVMIHVCLNYKTIIAFFKKTKQIKTDNQRTNNNVLKTIIIVVLILLFGGFCFWAGFNRGSTQIIINTSQKTNHKKQITPQDDLIKTKTIEHKGKTYNLAEYYHEVTKHTRISIMQKSPGLSWSQRPKVFKSYPNAKKTELPKQFKTDLFSTSTVINAMRNPFDQLAQTDREMSLRELSTLLHLTNGITKTKTHPKITYYLRSAPSAGALYPTITYVWVNKVTGFKPGLYHYDVLHHSLNLISSDDSIKKEQIKNAVNRPDLINNSMVTLFLTSEYHRTAWKYRGRSYRYLGMDAGHVAVQAMLASSALGYDTIPVAGFDDSMLNRFLEINDKQESAMLILPVGLVNPSPKKESPLLAYQTTEKDLGKNGNQLVKMIHGQTWLGLTQSTSLNHSFKPINKDYKGYSTITLPLIGSKAERVSIFKTINQRRSIRNWDIKPITINELSHVLFFVFGAITDSDNNQFFDFSLEGLNALNLYVLVNRVDGLDPGIYYYHRSTHQLSLIKDGNLRQKAFEMALYQEAVGNADVVVIKTLDTKRLGSIHGDRDYRYALFDAGMLGGRIYLMTTAIGLGCTGIGAFFDDEVSEVIKVDPQDEMILYLSAIGRKVKE